MDRKTITLVGAAAALAAGPAFAATAAEASPVPVAASYSELLQPIPNAVERLRTADAEADARPAQLIEAQYNRHHHHHHNYRNRGWYLRNDYSWYGGAWVLRPRNHHHHHHHHE